MAYTKPQQRKKEGSKRLRGEREIRCSLLILDLNDEFLINRNQARQFANIEVSKNVDTLLGG